MDTHQLLKGSLVVNLRKVAHRKVARRKAVQQKVVRRKAVRRKAVQPKAQLKHPQQVLAVVVHVRTIDLSIPEVCLAS